MIRDIIAGNSINETVSKILANIHTSGPVDQAALEKLSYIKKYHAKIMRKYEPSLMFSMGLFFKTKSPKNIFEETYSVYFDAIRMQLGSTFSPIQASIYNNILEKRYFSFSAPTSTGKSYLFRELIRRNDGDIVVVVPSRALVAEYLMEIYQIVENDVLVLQFVDNINIEKTKRRVFVITPERGSDLFKYSKSFNVKMFLFDEAHLSEEDERGIIFDSFVRRVDANFPNSKKIFAHPFVENPVAQLEKHSFLTNAFAKKYSQNTVGKIYIEKTKKCFRYFSPNEDTDPYEIGNDPIAEALRQNKSLLIFTSKSKIFDGSLLSEFQLYIDLCPQISNKGALALIDRLRKYIGAKSRGSAKKSQMIEMMKRGIVIHHGSMPLKARLIIEEFIKADFARICFATSTLSQGVNMPFDCVWVDTFKNLTTIGLKNLIGRSGRTSIGANTFDYGSVIINSTSKQVFKRKFHECYRLSSTSKLDIADTDVSEDNKDLIEALKTNSFNDELHLPIIQADRLSDQSIESEILLILNALLPGGSPLSGEAYSKIPKSEKAKIKKAFESIFVQHLRRQELTSGEKAVLSTAIPILLWTIQGRSFREIVSLRLAYLTNERARKKIKAALKAGRISDADAALEFAKIDNVYSQGPESLPNNRLMRYNSLKYTVDRLSFDLVVYDTYDYLDKVISHSLATPLSAAFLIYYKKTSDPRSKQMANYLRYGTNDETEILLLRYGFTFEDIDDIKQHITSISEKSISFKDSLDQLSEDQIEQVSRFL